MSKAFSLQKILYGGDYNPDQWLAQPEIIQEDFRLMPLAHINTVSVGIFAWSAIEPEEGVYQFEWLDQIMEGLAKRGIGVFLATPSGARPAWLAQKYPEVLRLSADRVRALYGKRHNHCFTSPVYREKVKALNAKLAERYGQHPGLKLWHVSNEYGGECHCPLCQEAFRVWLKVRYNHDLEHLNRAWSTSFWSHTYSDWAQIESPSPQGENLLHGHNLDWKRFVTDQTVNFMLSEMEPLQRISPCIPITTNMMGDYPGLNYWKFAPHLDVISWDSYPNWHVGPAGHGSDHFIGNGQVALWADRPEAQWGLFTAFMHNLNRSLGGGKPFLMIESSPSSTNWMSVSKLPRPGMAQLAALQAIAHGSDAVMYFQWRKSRGSSEKFHGAVVDHAGHENTRVFKEVAHIGQVLEKLQAVAGSSSPAEVAIIFDWENRWALDDARGPRNDGLKRYPGECMAHAAPFWERGIHFDVIDMDQKISSYKLVVAPMLYMLRPGVAARIEDFVNHGGTFVATYMSGWVDESDLCFLGGFPGPLRKVLGLWSEELDALSKGESNEITFDPAHSHGLKGSYSAHIFCERIHPEGAQTMARYRRDFYANEPAITVNHFGQGQAYYLAARTEQRLLKDLYGKIGENLGLSRAVDTDLPEGVMAQRRSHNGESFIFLMNFNATPHKVSIPDKLRCTDILNGLPISGLTELLGFGVRVLRIANL